MARYYPVRALNSVTAGSAQVHCHVMHDGRLTGCMVVRQTPLDQNFGDAARLVAEREYRATPMLLDGQPTDDGEAELTIDFKP